MYKIIDYIKEQWLRFTISFVIGVAILIIYNSTNSTWDQPIGYSNGCFIGGFSLACIGGLSIINDMGGFNIFSFYPNRKRKKDGKKEDYYEYANRKTEERSKRNYTCIPYFVFGALYLVAALIFFLVLKA